MNPEEGGGSFTPVPSVHKMIACVIHITRKRRQWQGGREKVSKNRHRCLRG